MELLTQLPLQPRQWMCELRGVGEYERKIQRRVEVTGRRGGEGCMWWLREVGGKKWLGEVKGWWSGVGNVSG